MNELIKVGTYTGNAEITTTTKTPITQIIDLGFRPKAVMVQSVTVPFGLDSSAETYMHLDGGMAIYGYAVTYSSKSVIEIVDNGFKVSSWYVNSSREVRCNHKDMVYYYIAIR